MKKSFLFLLLITSIISNAQVSDKIDGKWLVNLSLPDIGVVTTVLEIETDGNTYKAYSRKDADKLLLGNVKAPLIRKMSNFKNGSLIRVEKGEFIKVLDTIKLKGVLVSSMGNYNFIGYILKDSIDINLSKRNLVTYGRVVGNKKEIKMPLKDYPSLFSSAMEITKEKIYKKSLLDESRWKKFVVEMNKILPDIQDDLEMVSAFYYFGEKLNTSHFAFLKSLESSTENIEKRKCTTLEEKTPSTAYLKITSFDGSSKEIDSVFSIIAQKNYKNLIVDLRNNQGGTVEAGMAFANNIFIEPTIGGVFLTQKWFNKKETVPSLEEYNQFDNFSQSNYEQIISGIHNKQGLVLKVIPNKYPFKGNLFVLINKSTASTCEPLIYELKKQKRAVLVGEKSAGAMLNGEKFKLYDNYFIYIPTADYYSSDGYRIEQNGVTPNIETKSEEALDKVLKELIKE
jgi:Peptidase family S41